MIVLTSVNDTYHPPPGWELISVDAEGAYLVCRYGGTDTNHRMVIYYNDTGREVFKVYPPQIKGWRSLWDKFRRR